MDTKSDTFKDWLSRQSLLFRGCDKFTAEQEAVIYVLLQSPNLFAGRTESRLFRTLDQILGQSEDQLQVAYGLYNMYEAE